MSAPSIEPEELRKRIAVLPRESLAVLPTGLQALPRLAAAAGVAEFLVKRDDLTGMALGGSKTRLLEFILGEAVARGCDSIVAGGGSEQSNHAVQCVACANRLGLDTVVALQRRPDARSNGNALLYEVLGGRVEWIDADPELRDRTASERHMQVVADRLRSQGRRPYVLGSSLHPLSVVGYVNAALELMAQLEARGTAPTRVYITSEGAALGGLLLGARLLGLPWEVIGLDWRPYQPGTDQRVHDTIAVAADRLGLSSPLDVSDIVIHPVGGPSYGVGRPDTWRALATAARLEGIILDPVYTAKGMAGALADLSQRPLPADGRAVFVHTGGVPALFAYEAELRRHVIGAAS